MIEHVICLCLDRRKSMWMELEKQCLDKGWRFHRYIVGSGEDKSLEYDIIDIENLPSSWRWGSGLSAQKHYWAFCGHKDMIKKAIKNGWDNVLFLEDDSYLTSRFNLVWNQVELYLQASEYDLVRLGWHAYEYENHKFAGQNLEIEERYKKTGKAGLVTVQQCGGLFGALINKSLYNTILQLPAVAPIDSQLNQIGDSIRHVNILPAIIYVKSCWSECENIYIQRDEI